VTADQTGAEAQRVPLGVHSVNDLVGVDVHFIKRHRQLIHKCDVNIALAVLDDLNRLGSSEVAYRVGANLNNYVVDRLDGVKRFFVTTGNYFGDVFEPVYGNGYSSKSDKSSEEQDVVITPDMMWSCIATEVDIKDNVTPEIDEDHTITLYPAEQTSIYNYKIINVTNLRNVIQMCATISGMAGGLDLITQELDSKSVILPLEAYFNTKDGIIYGRFITFGHHEENPDPHEMELYVWLNDGQKLLYGVDTERFNVTEQVHAAPNKRRVNIVIDGLDLPQAIDNGQGFKPSVDDWITEDKEIIM
jgi:hypothetical protein